MHEQLTIQELFEAHQESLKLEWLLCLASGGRRVHTEEPGDESLALGSALIGHLNLVYPNRIQVLGDAELNYLSGLGKNSLHDALAVLFSAKPAAVIVCGEENIPIQFQRLAEKSTTPLMQTPLSSNKVINDLQFYLVDQLSEKSILHGVFMEVLGVGVLIAGASAVGKSELALELISRGHRLIADDAPEFSCVAPDTLLGRAPPAIENFLEVRGLGILNVRAMFGDSAVKDQKKLRLIVNLEILDNNIHQIIDRLSGHRGVRQVLGVDVPQVTLPVAPGRDLAVLIEAAVRNYLLYTKGYDSTQDFIEQQRQRMGHSE